MPPRAAECDGEGFSHGVCGGAERRWKQLRLKGIDADYQQVLDDLKKRDEQDMNREVDPLRPTDDATVVDTTGRTFEDSVKMILKLVEEKQSK